MAVTIDGETYYSASDVAELVGISRQTLWRWQQDKKVPGGQRFRGRMLVFTEEELDTIRQYANRLEPAGTGAPSQIPLFRAGEAEG